MTAGRTFHIAVIPGDGIGQEVVPEGIRVLDRLAELAHDAFRFEYDRFPWGCQYYLETGRMMDSDGLDRLQPCDAIYFGAVGAIEATTRSHVVTPDLGGAATTRQVTDSVIAQLRTPD